MTSTTVPGLEALLPIALDITSALTSADRSARLVEVVRRALSCDAVAILRLEGRRLVPVAAVGLAPDLRGRHFALDEHPRLERICASARPTRFPADCELPDPYDGLVRGSPTLDVHSCIGCPLRVEGELVGVLTLDALEAGVLDRVDTTFLVHLSALAAAALRTSDLIDALRRQAQHQGLVARDLVTSMLDRRGGRLIGDSAPMRDLRREIEVVAASDLPVLVTGETGVGKELVVRSLHQGSRRAERPLVYVNCAALPESIAESELFGHAKGAYTGAEESRLGKFRMADGASLFLDEIGDLPLHLQPKLLRALQAGEVQSIGADRLETVDVRVFAATNRDLRSDVAEGRFRADLFHRLDVCFLEVPPLRAHKEDIPALSGHFADALRRRLGCGPIRFTAEAQATLLAGAWPGNVRELENVVARGTLRASAAVARGARVLVGSRDLDVDRQAPRRVADVDVAATAEWPAGLTLRDAVLDFQREAVRQALAAAGGSWAAAGRSLGIDRSNLHHLARRLGLR